MKKYKVKPTKLQKKTFEHMKTAESLKDAMIAAGFNKSTATHPKQNLIDAPGFQSLIQEYREDLRKAGITKEVLAEIQAEGLFDQDAKVRLEYVRETKKDLGLNQEQATNTTNILVIPNELAKKYGITSDTKNSS